MVLNSTTAFLADGSPRPDETKIAEFLTDCLKLERGRPLVTLTAIIPDGKTLTRTFDTATKAAAWATAENIAAGGKNVYFQAADPVGYLTSKMRVEDVARLPLLVADVDPPKDGPQDPATLVSWQETAISKVEASADALQLNVHVIVTGGGLCVLAPLDTPVEDVREATNINKRLHQLYVEIGKVDGTHSAAHLMRLPGTVNWGDVAKRAAGRQPTLARWVLETDGVNSLSRLDMVLPALPPLPEGKGVPPAPGLWALLTERQIADVKSALASLPLPVVESREQWVKIGAVLHHWSGGASEAYAIWVEWARQARNFGNTNEAVWRSFSLSRSNPVTIGTLFYMAKEAGWSRDNNPATQEMRLEAAAADELPAEVHVKAGELAVLAAICERHLVDRGVPFYERGAMLVRPILEKGRTWNGGHTYTPVLVEVTAPYMRDMLSRHIHFTKTLKRKDDFVDVTIDPPKDIIEIMMARRGERQFKPISGVLAAPTLRPDGSVIDKPGYDEATGLYLMISTKPLEMPEHPTWDDARGAADLLDSLLAEFPYVDEPSRAVGMSETITPTVRGCMNVAPGHANTANAPGTGKSYKVDIAHMIATGMTCPVMNLGKTEEETEKRIGAAGIAGQAMLAFDNIESDVCGEALCTMLSQDVMDLRVLGKSEKIKAYNNFCAFFTGNNIVLKGDVVRRIVTCSMDAKMERPEQRHFKHNPLAAIASERERYIAACLTIVRAFILAGRPGLEQLTPFAGFDGWSASVRGALVWLGYADPVLTVERSRDEDPELGKLRALIAAIADEFGTGWENAVSPRQMFDTADIKGAQSALGEALAPWVRGKTTNNAAFGKWLKNFKGRRIGGVCIDSRMKDGLIRWFIDKTT